MQNKFEGYQCFHCLSNSVHWQSDFTFEDFGIEGDGIVNVCECANCGAVIHYYVSTGEKDEDNEQ